MRFIRGDSLKEAIDQIPSTRRRRSQGETAGRRLARDLALRKLLRRFIDVCNAIDYAHSRGVLHRDIKPANIIVGKHGETLVVDWGLAKPTGPGRPGDRVGRADADAVLGQRQSETLPGSALGTPAYMSPEQAEGQLERLGPRSDVYSLGATLYCLLTGQPPFAGEVVDVIRAVQRGEFRPPRQLDPSIDPALEAICLKAMATGPRTATPLAGRWPTTWIAGWPTSRSRPGASRWSRRARRWARRNRTAVTAAAVALVAGVVGLVGRAGGADPGQGRPAASLNARAKTRANAELTRSQAAVEARYDLAVEAIKTFHTGVSEDFLLKQEQFKDVRDRLLKSASDFYGKLGALLGKETDMASRRALSAGELRGGRADGQGRQAGGRAGGTPAGPRRPRGAGGRNPGRPGDQGRRGAQPDGRRPSAGDHRTDRGGGDDVPQGREDCWSNWPRRRGSRHGAGCPG